MSQVRTHQWRELCLRAVSELEPERRLAIVAELASFLRENSYRLGPLWIDLAQAKVKRNDKPVNLTRLEFRLLRHLIERAGLPVTREELLRSVWGYDREVFTHTVEVHVNRLRRKLEQDAKRPEIIVTVPGMGYKFVPSERPDD